MNDDRTWQIRALLTGIVAAALLAGGTARGDADDGLYLGFRLGEKFDPPEVAQARSHVAGPLIYDFPVNSRDHGAESMTIFVTPESSIIGSIFGEWYFANRRAAQRFADRYFTTLRRKYPEWSDEDRSLTSERFQLFVDVQKQSANDEFWPSSQEYRVSASLIYSPDSLNRGEWMAIVYLESANLELATSQLEADSKD